VLVLVLVLEIWRRDALCRAVLTRPNHLLETLNPLESSPSTSTI
jgi:hypothetical protein